jgi:hypothetical protein
MQEPEHEDVPTTNADERNLPFSLWLAEYTDVSPKSDPPTHCETSIYPRKLDWLPISLLGKSNVRIRHIQVDCQKSRFSVLA